MCVSRNEFEKLSNYFTENISSFYGVSVLNVGQLVIICYMLRHERDAVVVIKATNVILNVVYKGVPVMMNFGNIPTKGRSILDKFSDNSSLMHQLLGDATDIHAGTTQTPGRAMG